MTGAKRIRLMKIFINGEHELKNSIFLIDYFRNTSPEYLEHIVLVDIKPCDEAREWATAQTDFTYIYFEEDVTPGKAYNQIINELQLSDDILLMDNCHIPLVGSIERLYAGLCDNEDAFAVGPVSNTSIWSQAAAWNDAETAFDWSENKNEKEYEEVLFLSEDVVLLSRTVLIGEKPFSEDPKTVKEMITEKCIREFYTHKRMYVCKNSGFWDVRGDDYRYLFLENTEFIEQSFGIHYLNVRGNDCIVGIITDCVKDTEKELDIMEIGCDCGGTLFALKKIYRNSKLYGTDINEGSLRFASEFAEVRVNNIEEKNLDFGNTKFDIIIFGDVLEHLRDPLSTIIYCKTLLKRGGRIAASIPNLMNIEVMKYILNGDFPYAEYGLLDKTHIHLFTYNEIVRMFTQQAGYRIEKISMNGQFTSEDERLADQLLKLGKAQKFMYQAFQYQLMAYSEN